MRERGFGRVVLKTATDRPWSQYFCCMLAGNTTLSADYPVATKRVVRAILKSADICVAEPEAGGAACWSMAASWTATTTRCQRPGRGALRHWREYDPEDTLRFYALRLHEVGMIKSSPNELIAAGTDWRFLNEIKRELKT